MELDCCTFVLILFHSLDPILPKWQDGISNLPCFSSGPSPAPVCFAQALQDLEKQAVRLLQREDHGCRRDSSRFALG